MAVLAPSDINESMVADKSERVLELREFNLDSWLDRLKIKRIMDGGPEATIELIGRRVRDPEMRLPVGNLMYSAMSRLAQKLGQVPDGKIDPPYDTDDERALLAAEKRGRLLSVYDEVAALEMMLPQLGRWVPGYGYTVVDVKQMRDENGEPFPGLQMQDPFNTFIGEWGVEQQPPDYATITMMSVDRLLRNPKIPLEAKEALQKRKGTLGGATQFAGDKAGWANQAGQGVEVYTYTDIDGRWVMLPEDKILLAHVPNLLNRPPFWAFKHFSFSKLTGKYDHVIGLMANMARLNMLFTIGIEDSVLSETNIIGDMEQQVYRRGRGATNYFAPGTQIQKMNAHVPFEAFTHGDKIERQLRIVAGYPVTDDAQSPNSFVTGRGLDELTSSADREVNEYFTVLGYGLRKLDSLRFEFDERHYGGREKTMEGAVKGAPFAETYDPAVDIAGHRRTRRVYGVMAGFDEATKIITGLQLVQGEIIDDDTMRERMEGLDNHEKIKERITYNKAQKAVFDALLARAQQGDPIAMEAAIELLPEGTVKKTMTQTLQRMQEQIEAQAEAEAQANNPLAELAGGPPPDAATVLSRITTSGGRERATGGIQTVGRFQ